MTKAEMMDQGERFNLSELSGRVENLRPIHNGTGWTVQNGTLRLTNGEQVAVAFWNRDSLTHLQNKNCHFTGKEEKGGTIKLGRVKKGEKAGNLEISIGEHRDDFSGSLARRVNRDALRLLE